MMNPFNLISECNREKGLTLMEVMIAITLLAFVMIGIVTVTENSMNSKERTVQINKDNLQIENALNRMEWDFTQLYSPLYFSDRLNKNLDPSMNGCTNCQDIFEFYEGNPRFRFPSTSGLPVPTFQTNGKDEVVIFTTSNRRKMQDMKQANFLWVRYSLGEGEKQEPTAGAKEPITSTGKDLIRQISSEDPFTKENFSWDDIKASTLLKNVESLEFLFFNPQSKKFETNLTSSPQGEHLIRGVQMKIKWSDSQGFKREMNRYFRPLWAPVVVQDPNSPTNNSGTTNGGQTTNGQTTSGSNDGAAAGAGNDGGKDGEED